MKLRVARHTKDLEPIIHFYRDILGLKITGQFAGHDDYDGVFLGIKGADWHLEFTVSKDQPHHSSDEDDLLVFYPKSADEFNSIIGRFAKYNILHEIPKKNPYWQKNGIMFSDPDGFKIVIVRPGI